MASGWQLCICVCVSVCVATTHTRHHHTVTSPSARLHKLPVMSLCGMRKGNRKWLPFIAQLRKKEADFIIYCELFSDIGKVGRLRKKILDQSVNEECSWWTETMNNAITLTPTTDMDLLRRSNYCSKEEVVTVLKVRHSSFPWKLLSGTWSQKTHLKLLWAL